MKDDVSIQVEDDAVASPCVQVCKMNASTGLCAGCQRTLAEIACWSIYTAAEKRAVLDELPARRKPG